MADLDQKLKIQTEKIEAAITDFEKTVDFELVPVIAERSTPVFHIPWIISFVVMTLVFAGFELYYLTQWNEWDVLFVLHWLSGLFVASLALGFILVRFEAVQRFFTPHKLRADYVQQKAQKVFLEKRLFETHTHQGLLLFISLMEHRIVVLPDVRSNFQDADLISAEVLKILQDDFKAGSYEKGLLDAIAYLKKTLVSRFPHTETNNGVNQLPNKLIWWSE